MPKYVARVTEVLNQVQKVADLVDGEVRVLADMPAPSRVEIIPEGPDGPYMMYRYTSAGDECGDTWHLTLEEAFQQAGYEYGLRPEDFLRRDP
jgi:hypothetical protein